MSAESVNWRVDGDREWAVLGDYSLEARADGAWEFSGTGRQMASGQEPTQGRAKKRLMLVLVAFTESA